MDTFEALNDDIKVNLVAIEENDQPTQMAAASAAGNIPEVIEMGSELAVAFGSEGIMDFRAHESLINQIGRNDFWLFDIDNMFFISSSEIGINLDSLYKDSLISPDHSGTISLSNMSYPIQ